MKLRLKEFSERRSVIYNLYRNRNRYKNKEECDKELHSLVNKIKEEQDVKR